MNKEFDFTEKEKGVLFRSLYLNYVKTMNAQQNDDAELIYILAKRLTGKDIKEFIESLRDVWK